MERWSYGEAGPVVMLVPPYMAGSPISTFFFSQSPSSTTQSATILNGAGTQWVPDGAQSHEKLHRAFCSPLDSTLEIFQFLKCQKYPLMYGNTYRLLWYIHMNM